MGRPAAMALVAVAIAFLLAPTPWLPLALGVAAALALVGAVYAKWRPITDVVAWLLAVAMLVVAEVPTEPALLEATLWTVGLLVTLWALHVPPSDAPPLHPIRYTASLTVAVVGAAAVAWLPALLAGHGPTPQDPLSPAGMALRLLFVLAILALVVVVMQWPRRQRTA